MPEGLGGLEPTKILLFIAPGAIFAIFRSFAIKGFFPKLSKDDLGALAISSVVYALFVKFIGTDFMAAKILNRRSSLFWIFILFVLPTSIGIASGLVEGNDYVGYLLRKVGFRFPSPEPNAWETMFREMPAKAFLMIRLGDETWVYGRWVAGSASSQLTDSRDLYLSEIGSLTDDNYEPFNPQRGVYLSPGEIKRIEVVKAPMPAADEGDEA